MVLYVIGSFLLLFGAEKNLKRLHLPWLTLHPLVAAALMALMGCFAFRSFGRRGYVRDDAFIVFAMFLVFWILTYLWVVVVGNYQSLEADDAEDTTLLLDGWPGLQQPGRHSRGTRSQRTNAPWAPPSPPSPVPFSLPA
ncbi:unnamed protein product [Darwinula stevensoni]|uniref:Uncharacterized protein n=1 Tax=Darwinula stevensoni TaxID=69355 RepID=A0A7R9FSG3_9CRUS|nr:unnamed protein product [Darwinula stevensoni]CAG0903676.1 unnamed protein product [Darwinula stevensoni]